jgi:hypothetical protein
MQTAPAFEDDDDDDEEMKVLGFASTDHNEIVVGHMHQLQANGGIAWLAAAQSYQGSCCVVAHPLSGMPDWKN